jgi:hypothetical protein
MAKAEIEARDAKKGLWSDPNPVPPWEYRLKKNQQSRYVLNGEFPQEFSSEKRT